MNNSPPLLALAYRFTGKPAYAEQAAWCLRVWFLDPATSMKPHRHFGQGIPGRNPGRNLGIIEGGGFASVGKASGLLLGSAAWPAEDDSALPAWPTPCLDRLLHRPLGRQEVAGKQNHGSLCDVPVMRLALVTGRPDPARQTAEAAKPKRIAVQIEPAGRGIRRALDFMAPCVQIPPEPRPRPQIEKLNRAATAPICRQVAIAYREPANSR